LSKRTILLVFIFLAVVGAGAVLAEEARLLRAPAISKENVAFVYGGDIWVVPRAGGEARRLTTSQGLEGDPFFSPDGRFIAFTGQYDGNTDVFVVPISGGEPKRLTFHPTGDIVRGWAPDGSGVLFASGRTSAPVPYPRLWIASLEGGLPQPLPLPMANRGCYSPDGKRMAYVPLAEAFAAWRHYRGGRTTEIWIVDLADYSVEKIPREGSNDTYPMWIGDKVYFLSDRNYTMNLFAYDTVAKTTAQLTFHDDFDVKYASAGDGLVVYEQAGYLHVFDPAAGRATRLVVELSGDIAGRRPHIADVSAMIRSGDISPTGKRAVFEARGEIFTVPEKKGDFRNLTGSPGVHDRSPAWSPDGASIAWFSDEGGEYQLMIGDQKGEKEPRAVKLENPSFYYSPAWSPDSKKILFTDKHLSIWYVEVESGKAVKVDSDTYDHPDRSLEPVWAPDSNWIAYSKRLDNQMHALFIYSLKEAKSYQITDGLSDAVSPAFDKGGKYLYFLAGTDYGLNTGWLDMTSYERPVTRGVYLTVLAADEPSPLLPESDEEEVKKEEAKEEKKAEEKKADEKKGEEEKKPAEEKIVKIDFAGLDQRILAVDVPQRDYYLLKTGEEGVFFYAERVPNQRGFSLHRYNLKERKTEPFLTGVFGYTISADGKKLLYFAQNLFGIVDAGGKANMGDGKLQTDQLQMLVDPQAEWAQMFLESWRINRDFFYDTEMHGADWQAVYEKYRQFLPYVGHRSDLNYIFANLIGELTVGHAYVGGGDSPDVQNVPVGLLGADYTVENGRYRIAKIFTGENWNPELRAPLTEPGIKVSEGDYILEVNGVELKAPMNIYSLFQGTAGKQIFVRVNDKPDLDGARLLTVVPVPSEFGLRARAWIEDNRRKVDQLSGGRLAYVYLPNTSGAGYTNFNRYYYMQQDKEGAVIDERFNGGGSAADYMVDMMNRPVLNYWATRDGKTFATPAAAILGPKVMIINEWAGSGGDALPYYFRKRAIGPLVGKRTWGGLVGIYDYPVLLDGGFITAPRLAFYGTSGRWEVENEGVPPDIEVDMAPAPVIAGGDPQLERAVREALKLLDENPVKRVPRPAPIDRVSKP
jgi:tricorn protease